MELRGGRAGEERKGKGDWGRRGVGGRGRKGLRGHTQIFTWIDATDILKITFNRIKIVTNES